MSALLTSLSSLAFNNATQRILSQSNNISYAARGVYRVNETPAPRKGDYWFRDFWMVMACSYMTELGFRGVDRYYTVPLLTEALNLQRLNELKHPISKKLLYPGALNYSELPEMFRTRMTGTLIRNSSDLVPGLLKQAALDKLSAQMDVAKAKKNTNAANLLGKREAILKGSLEQANAAVSGYMSEAKLLASPDISHNKSIQEAINRIAMIENKTAHRQEIQSFLQANPSVNAENFKGAIKIEKTRQLRILLEHMEKNLNFDAYVKENYLNKNHTLHTTVQDVIKEYAARLENLHEKGKRELPTLLKSLQRLPVNKREADFDKKVAELRNQLFLKNGVPLVEEQDITGPNGFNKLMDDIKTALKSEDDGALKPMAARIEAYYKNLKTESAQEKHLNLFWDNAGGGIKDKIKKKIDDIVSEVQQGEPRKALPTLTKKLDDLGLAKLFPDKATELATLTDALKKALPKADDAHFGSEFAKNTGNAVADFMKSLSGKTDDMLKPLVKDASESAFKGMIIEALQNRVTNAAVSQIQKSSTWPKMIATVLLNFIFYGFMASNFDNKILQPFQKKLVAERGTSEDIPKAGYLGLLPASLWLTQFFDKTSVPFVKKMNYFARFTAVGGAALATFGAASYLFLQQRLKTPPKNPPKPQAAGTSSNGTSPGANLSSKPAAQSGFQTASFSPSGMRVGLPVKPMAMIPAQPGFQTANVFGTPTAFALSPNPYAAQFPVQAGFARPQPMRQPFFAGQKQEAP